MQKDSSKQDLKKKKEIQEEKCLKIFFSSSTFSFAFYI